jgi:prolyl-tRNA synthetase
MLLSKYFLPTKKDVSKDLVLASHKYLVRAGMIKQVAEPPPTPGLRRDGS